MAKYVVIVGNTYLKNRREVHCATLEDCQKAVRDYTITVSGIYDYGYFDEGMVFSNEGNTPKYLGRISYNGRFWNKNHPYGKKKYGKR